MVVFGNRNLDSKGQLAELKFSFLFKATNYLVVMKNLANDNKLFMDNLNYNNYFFHGKLKE